MFAWILQHIVGVTIQGYCFAAAGIGFILALELLFPRDNPPSWRARVRGMSFTLVAIPLSVVLYQAVKLVVNPQDIRPLFATTQLFAGPLGIALSMFAAIVFTDLIFYWFHRTLHAVPALWRFHAIHHSVRELGAGSAYVHYGESTVKIVLYSIPIAFIIPDPLVGVVGFLVGLQAVYIHSANRVHIGPLRYLFVDNRMHRIHHSTNPAHFDRNFGVTVTIWDQLFGTAYFPKPDEWPDTGLDDTPEPQTVREFVTQPFLLETQRARGPDRVEAI